HPSTCTRSVPRTSRCADDRRRIKCLADSVTTDLSRGTRLLYEMEHVLDARHTRIHDERPSLPETPSQPVDLQPLVRFRRKLRPPTITRRSRLWKTVAARQDAGRHLGKTRQPPTSLWIHVRTSWQEAPLHGRGIRTVGRMGL